MSEVFWEATVPGRDRYSDSMENGSWRSFNKNIICLRIFSDKGQGKIDDFKDGYFICNKCICVIGGDSLELAGIGYWTKGDPMVRIKWYNKEDMQLHSTEARPKEECLSGLKTNI